MGFFFNQIEFLYETKEQLEALSDYFFRQTLREGLLVTPYTEKLNELCTTHKETLDENNITLSRERNHEELHFKYHGMPEEKAGGVADGDKNEELEDEESKKNKSNKNKFEKDQVEKEQVGKDKVRAAG